MVGFFSGHEKERVSTEMYLPEKRSAICAFLVRSIGPLSRGRL